MTKYLASAALAAVLGAAAFTSPAAAQVGISVGVGPGHDYRHYDHYDNGPGVRVYTGRNAYRDDDCRVRKTVKWVNGQKIVKEVRRCD